MLRRRWIACLAGLLLGAVAYLVPYLCATAKHRALAQQSEPEMAWLKNEYHLSDAQYDRIVQLHQQYLVLCGETCARIAAKGEELKRLLAQTNRITPEIEENLAQSAQLRAECERRMLNHFYEVSRAMPPAAGERYLRWVQERTILRSHSHAMAEMHAQ